MTDPLISVIMPAWNGAEYMSAALASLDGQAYPALEIVVVDDGSIDATAHIARSHARVVYVSQTHQGYPQALNRGLRAAQGSFLAFLDQDDYRVRNSLHLQLAHLLQNPQTAIVAGYVQPVRALQLAQDGRPVYQEVSAAYSLLNLGSVLCRREVFETVGDFDTDYRTCCDWDWFLRVREQNIRLDVHTDVVLLYRRHAQGLTRRKELLQRDLLLLFKKSLDRRRKLGAAAGELSKLADFMTVLRRDFGPLE